MSYIPVQTIIEDSAFEDLDLKVGALDDSEIEFKGLKQPYDEEFNFKLGVRSATKLHEILTEFLKLPQR